jgi:hypothetical protein
MAKKLQLRGGTTSEHSTFTGAAREVTVDTTKDSLVVHDGTTAGGIPIAKSSDITLGTLSVTATAAELNILDGVTATAAELNYVDGVTSNIQTQLGTKLPLAGGTMTGDVSLGDNVKANFGAGNDLQIYHDGSNSYIYDAGTGTLNLRASSAINLQTPGGAASLASFSENGANTFYYAGSAKLATTTSGIDVTGTVGATTVDLGNWTVTESAGVLKFATGGVDKAKLDASGNFTVVGDVTAFGTI